MVTERNCSLIKGSTDRQSVMSVAASSATACINCKAVREAYGTLYWLILFKATQERDVNMNIEETTEPSAYTEHNQKPYMRRCRCTTLCVKTPAEPKRVQWTVWGQDDEGNTEECRNARILIHADYPQGITLGTAKVILETIRALWDHIRQYPHNGQAWLQQYVGDTIRFRIVFAVGEHNNIGGKYRTMAWMKTSPEGPLGEFREPGTFAQQLAPNAAVLQGPEPPRPPSKKPWMH